MKIVSLTSENFKRLTAVHIEPDGNLVQITGKNAQGKSSVLDSIWVALAGIAVAPKEPIRKGAEAARISLDLGDIKVTRHFRRDGKGSYTTSLTVENAEGARYPSPQKLLDGLLGALSFDPLAFSRLDAKGQFDALRKFVPGVDFEAIESAQRADFQKRSDINRRQKEAHAAAERIQVPDAPPIELQDESALVTKLREAGEHNADIERRRSNRTSVAQQIAGCRDQVASINSDIEDLSHRIAEMQARAQTITNEADELEKKLSAAAPLPESIDVSAVAAELNAARESNQHHAQWAADRKRHAELASLAEQLAKESDEITARMAERQQSKQAAIAKAHMPIDGIEFGDGQVLLNGVPFDQGSDAEKLRASVAIAMAANPKLRVVRIRDGSLLDEDGLKLIAELADARDCQVWIERVDSSGAVGVVLEDGHVRAAEQQQESVA